jgi:hypothetical protein
MININKKLDNGMQAGDVGHSYGVTEKRVFHAYYGLNIPRSGVLPPPP